MEVDTTMTKQTQEGNVTASSTTTTTTIENQKFSPDLLRVYYAKLFPYSQVQHSAAQRSTAQGEII